MQGLTSRTKNLFVQKENLRGDVVNETVRPMMHTPLSPTPMHMQVINTWLADLVRAAGGGGIDGWEFVREADGVTLDLLCHSWPPSV